MGVLSNIEDTIDALGDIELSGLKLEEADRELLDVSKGSLHQHVAMQPAAMSYYITLKKEAKRRLDNIQGAYSRWEKKRYAVAKVVVLSGTHAVSSIKVEDVKAQFITDNEPDIVAWEEKVDKIRAEYDLLDAWCDAWKQKSFSLREYVDIDDDERFAAGGGSIMKRQEQPPPSPVPQKRHSSTKLDATESATERIKRVREIMRNKRRANDS